MKTGVAIARLSCSVLLAAATFACASPSEPDLPTYTGSFAGEETLISGSNLASPSCAWLMSYTGTMTISLEQRQDGTVAGTAEARTTQYAVISQLLGPPPPNPGCFAYTPIVNEWSLPVTGTTANLAFSGSDTYNGISTQTFTFSGALTDGVISGTATYTEFTSSGGPGGSSGSATFSVTLR